MWRGSCATPGGTLYFVVDEESGAVLRSSFRNEMDKGISLRQRSGLHTACQRYFDGDFDAFNGFAVGRSTTSFTRTIYAHMRMIQPATPMTYGDLAKAAGFPGAARAVGSACARNKIVLIVPCHRVISAKGIGGFEYGTTIKKKLLTHEGSPDLK